MSIIVPKRWISTQEIWDGAAMRPLIFLVGPVRGGADWQTHMYRLIRKQPRTEQAIVAIPCRWGAGHALEEKFLKGPSNCFARQLDWERHFLELAALGRGPGCIVCWLPLESETEPHPGPEPYGMDTRGELGEWRMRMKFEGARLVLGAHPEFHGISQIQRNFSAVLGYDFPVHDSMERLAKAAANAAFGIDA